MFAINPDFSLLYSATHQNNFGEQYNYFEDSEAAEIMKGLVENAQSDSIPTVLTNKRPEVIMIILESFSNHLMEVTGGENVAVNLNNIAKEGLLFNNFYANSFRTDRALTSIISAYPAQPSTSIMKYVEKAETLPSIPKTLRDNGYDIGYYYGGDANFTNMLAYLVSCKFDKIISDKDFPLSQRQSKWGANDGTLLKSLLATTRPTSKSCHDLELSKHQAATTRLMFRIINLRIRQRTRLPILMTVLENWLMN